MPKILAFFIYLIYHEERFSNIDTKFQWKMEKNVDVIKFAINKLFNVGIKFQRKMPKYRNTLEFSFFSMSNKFKCKMQKILALSV